MTSTSDHLIDFKIEGFLLGLSEKPNEEAFYFARTVELFRYSDRPNAPGVHIWSWLKEHDIIAKSSCFRQGNSEIFVLIFSERKYRDDFLVWYKNNEINQIKDIFPGQTALINFVTNAQRGYYISAGHLHKDAESNYELFHWLRTNVKSGLFYVGNKLFFTNQDDELQYTLRWKNVEPAE